MSIREQVSLRPFSETDGTVSLTIDNLSYYANTIGRMFQN